MTGDLPSVHGRPEPLRPAARELWLSRRALWLHLSVAVSLPGCLAAWWWQVHRAMDGNGLSYLYAVEWPVFAAIAVYLWWSLIHTDLDSVGAKAQKKITVDPASRPSFVVTPPRRRDEEDAALAAYNDRLAELAARGAPKTWRDR